MSNIGASVILNESQEKAVQIKDGYVRIIAGAGSGKTRVLTERIAYLLQNNLAESYEILAITFTNKAAKEMRERITETVGAENENMWVMTYHAFCARILRFHIQLLGYDNNFVILDANDQKAVLKDLYKPYALKATDYPLAMVLSRISNYKMQQISVEQANAMAFTDAEKIIVKLYEDYDNYLQKQKVLDFDDLLLMAVDLFKKHPDVLNKYATRFRFIHVDEFQDTNDIQFELIEMLASVHHNLYIVGDPDQAIYSWRGANDRLILDFDTKFKNAETITLDQNYRSTQNILDAANRLIHYNTNRLDKELFSNIHDGDAISVYEADDEKNEADFIAVKLKGMIRRRDDSVLGKTAVLYRANYLSRALEEGFIRHGLPYVIYGDTRFLDRKEVKDMLSYMQLVLNPYDDIAFKRIINEPKRNVGEKTLEKLQHIADTHDVSLFEALGITIDQSGKGKSRQFLIDFQQLILDGKKELNALTLDGLLDYLYVESGYEVLLQKDAAQVGRIDNITELKQALVEYEAKHQDIETVERLALYLQEMALMSSVDKTDNTNSVSFMTIHAAKGLEFDNVFVIGMNEGIFPSKRSVDEGGLEEERRLAYVAITRAKKSLFVSYPNGFNVLTKESKRPSTFLFEANLLTEQDAPMFDEVPVFMEKKASKKTTKMAYSKDATESAEDLITGDKVQHKKFGEGVIVSIEDERITVAFAAEFGIKTLVANFIEKI